MKKISSDKHVAFITPAGTDPSRLAHLVPMPQLGPLYLATIAQNAGFNVTLINEALLGRNIRWDELTDVDVLCLSCMTSTIKRGKEIAQQFKLIHPHGKVIIGGIHVSMIPSDIGPEFDHVIVGEAEHIFLDVLLGSFKERIIYGSQIENLDELPVADLSLVQDANKIRLWPIMTSRGCPHNCIYCSSAKMFGKRYRSQSPERIVKELSNYTKGHILFFDDNFTANPKRTETLSMMMIENGFNRPWSAEVRTETTKNPALISKMRDAGCDSLGIGFESINQKSLVDMKKGQTVEDIRRSVKVLHDNGIKVYGMFILGNDSDTKEVFKNTADFCQEMEIDLAQYSILTPFPGTQLYAMYEEQNRILHKNWEYYDALHVVFKPKNMTAYELQEGLIETYSNYYSSSNAMRDIVKHIKNFPFGFFRKLRPDNWLPYGYTIGAKLYGKKLCDELDQNNEDYFTYLRHVSKSEEATEAG